MEVSSALSATLDGAIASVMVLFLSKGMMGARRYFLSYFRILYLTDDHT